MSIEPKGLVVSIERRGRLLVAKPARKVARLRGATFSAFVSNCPRAAVDAGVAVIEPAR